MAKSNKRSYTALEINLVVVGALVIFLFIAGYLAYQTPPTNTKSLNVADAKSTTSNPYSNWKSYSSSIQNDTFYYPSNWKLNSQNDTSASGSSNQNPSQMVTMTSPSGFILAYYDTVTPETSSCSDGVKNDNILSVDTLKTTNSAAPIYLLSFENSGKFVGLYSSNNIPQLGDSGTCSILTTFPGTAPNSQISFGSALNYGATDDYIKNSKPSSADLATAKLILASFKFNK